jgi:hypothetical protein
MQSLGGQRHHEKVYMMTDVSVQDRKMEDEMNTHRSEGEERGCILMKSRSCKAASCTDKDTS